MRSLSMVPMSTLSPGSAIDGAYCGVTAKGKANLYLYEAGVLFKMFMSGRRKEPAPAPRRPKTAAASI